jgi:hypothetical protein
MGRILFNTRYGLEGLRNWVKVAWQDRQWDHYYIIKVLSHKLDLMVKYREDKRHCQYVRDEKDLEKMIITRDALKRLVDDDYCLLYDDATESDNKQKEDLALVFDTMKDNIMKWWD